MGETPTLKYAVVQSRLNLGEWRVEAINYGGEGEVYLAIFHGPSAEERAWEYAYFKNAQVIPAPTG